MKYKTINYELYNSKLLYRLNDKKLYLKHNGLSFSDYYINPNLDLLIDDNGTLNISNISISKISGTKYKIIRDDYDELLELLYYYLNDNNERIYVDKENITINSDGTLIYDGHIIKTYYKSDSGYRLSGDYADFINSNNKDF